MGGPTLESYRAAEAAWEARRAAMRTRDGVVDLEEWREAMNAAHWVAKAFRDVPWFLRVRPAPAGTVGFELELTILQHDTAALMCLPSRVNDIPVRVVVRNPGRPAPLGRGGSGP